MQNFIKFLKEFRIPRRGDLSKGFSALSRKEFRIFFLLFIIAAISLVVILNRINNSFLVQVPDTGGSITEGIVGIPTLVNPVLAVSDADKDMVSLIYSGLMRKMSDGSIAPDLALSYEISTDGKKYTFTLRDDAYFHNGDKVTADDIVFTLEKIKDPLIKSPKRVQWEGVLVEKIDEKTISFTLKQPYASFLNSTTLGILPSEVWKNVSSTEFSLSNLNLKAVGSGPYMVSSVSKNKEGIPESYTLKRFTRFTLGKPYITSIKIVSFANEKELVSALKGGSISQAGGISPEYIETIGGIENVKTSILPRMFGLFFNPVQNKVLGDQAVINAINKSIDREAIIDNVLKGYGEAITLPVPNDLLNTAKNYTLPTATTEEINAALDKAGWIKGEDGIRQKGTIVKTTVKKVTTTTVKGPFTRLSFSITTGDTPELKQAATVIKDTLLTIGMGVDVKVYETGQLNQIIRSRSYEALFFGQVINNESDLFGFWHSSQKTDPGLNIALYTNTKVDSLLDSAQQTLTKEDRIAKYDQFAEIFKANTPAIFVYSPKYVYVSKSNIYMSEDSHMTLPQDRFSDVYLWYKNTDKIWKVFAQ